MEAQLPQPVANADSLPYWNAARERKLLIRKCKACGELGYKGLVITDSLLSPAVLGGPGPVIAAIAALRAGDDMLLLGGGARVYEPIIIEPGVRVTNSVLRGPLIIGRDTEIVDSYVGPCTSIDHSCRIKGCRIEDSVVMEETVIEEVHWPIVKSLIGRCVELSGSHGVGGGYSLTLGDHSRIEMPDG